MLNYIKSFIRLISKVIRDTLWEGEALLSRLFCIDQDKYSEATVKGNVKHDHHMVILRYS